MIGFLLMIFKAVLLVFGICLILAGCSTIVIVFVLSIRELIKTMRQG